MPRLSLLRIYTSLQQHGGGTLDDIVRDIANGLSVGNTLVDLLNLGSRISQHDVEDDGGPVSFSLGLSHLEAITAINKWNFIRDILSGVNDWLISCASLTNDNLFQIYNQNLTNTYRDNGFEDSDDDGSDTQPARVNYSNLDLDFLESLRNQLQIIAFALPAADLEPALRAQLTALVFSTLGQIDSIRERLAFRIAQRNRQNSGPSSSIVGVSDVDDILWNFVIDDDLANEILAPTQAGPAPANQNNEEEKKEK